MGRLLLFLCGLCAFCGARAQEPDSTREYHYPMVDRNDEITLLTGYHQGQFGFAELGLGRDLYGSNRHPYGVGWHAGAEFRVDRPELWGAKVGAYIEGGMAMGAHLVLYRQGYARCTVFRPEIGVGLFKCKLTYAYNVPITKPRMDGINTHMLSLTYAFRLIRLPKDDHRKHLDR